MNGTTWGWVINYSIFTFGWTNPSTSLFFTLSSCLFLHASDGESVSSQHPFHSAESTAHRKSPAAPGKCCHTKWGPTVGQLGWCMECLKVFCSTIYTVNYIASLISFWLLFSLNISFFAIRSKWPNGNQIPPYFPEFYDGWQPLPPVPSQSPPVSRQLSRSNSERFPPVNVNQRPPEQVKTSRGQTSV